MQKLSIPSVVTFFLFGGLHSLVAGTRNSAFIGYHETERVGPKVKEHPPMQWKVKISSSFGEFIVKLRPDLAPDTCLLVWELAQKSNCPNCKFYRHEPVPMNWSQDGFYGPPYALLQGSLSDLARQPPFENAEQLQVKRGHVCMIPNCKEFFIATADHPEWGASHTIFGEVEDMSAEPSYPFEPFHTATNSDQITTRWLDNTYLFNLTAIEPVPSSSSGAAGTTQQQQQTATQQQQQALTALTAATTTSSTTSSSLSSASASSASSSSLSTSTSSLSSTSSSTMMMMEAGISPGVLLDRMEVDSE